MNKNTNEFTDFLSLGKRDEYIGWNKEQRKLKNRNIANIQLCVPTRNFGYNESKRIKSVPLYAVFCINSGL